MLDSSLPTLCIIVGTRCGFSCRHCLIEKQTRDRSLTSRETSLLQRVISKHASRLSFSGGEPTLYIPNINKIVSAHPAPHKLKLGITTNGSFAVSRAAAQRTLGMIPSLQQVRLSYDRFHAEFLPFSYVKNLYTACKRMGLSFRVVLCMQSPLDLTLVKKLEKLGDFRIEVQPVCDVGEARKNKVAFTYPVFDRKILSKYCPNRNQLAYMCGKGFSVCCSNLVFNNVYNGCVHATPEEHMKSSFYKVLTRLSFGELLKKFKISELELSPDHSTGCSLCEYIFKKPGVSKRIKHMRV